MAWTSDVKDFVYSVIIGVVFVLISAALVPWIANTIVSPYVMEYSPDTMRNWFLFETAVTLGSLAILSLIAGRYGVSWKGIAEKGGIIGILVGMAVLSFFGPQKVMTTGLAVALSWMFSLFMDKWKNKEKTEIPWAPILYLVSFIVFLSVWYGMNGTGPSDILEEGSVIFFVMPAYLAVALAGISKGGYRVALFIDALWIIAEGLSFINAIVGARSINEYIEGIVNTICTGAWLMFAVLSPIVSKMMYERHLRIERRRKK